MYTNGGAESVRNIENRNLLVVSGYTAIAVSALVTVGLGCLCVFSGFSLTSLIVSGLWGLSLATLMPSCLFTNGPNEAKVVIFFGEYIGTTSKTGLLFSIPYTSKRSVSLKVESTNTSVMKVNDSEGNPIEIAAAIVWRVTCPEKVCFNIENYQGFISVQGETALRELAGSYPYDAENGASLRQNFSEISQKLKIMLQSRMGIVGIEVEDARISHLAYSSEIAQVMLRRQQAKAISEARVHIVKNAVNMVDEVLLHLEKKHKISLTDDQKIKFSSNLLVALVSDSDTQPVINVE
ncbi:SPFH domain-containing protein [Candidatus Anaplasma sp. TIGMIC]|uniref:SPFH domain-containing protein n=1 Tax=Candidatus Anaplasma sp. TIGMIC TaxID=3020713 RepID=UPI00232C6CA1|nr:SPFH domain-containing protein [Candidatus Anaplasma sp. TIGMIC]MDB1135202.1 SPFH domain-containing protein [Candidatus Anaplasma sp. TIGMIC]